MCRKMAAFQHDNPSHRQMGDFWEKSRPLAASVGSGTALSVLPHSIEEAAGRCQRLWLGVEALLCLPTEGLPCLEVGKLQKPPSVAAEPCPKTAVRAPGTAGREAVARHRSAVFHHRQTDSASWLTSATILQAFDISHTSIMYPETLCINSDSCQIWYTQLG